MEYFMGQDGRRWEPGRIEGNFIAEQGSYGRIMSVVRGSESCIVKYFDTYMYPSNSNRAQYECDEEFKRLATLNGLNGYAPRTKDKGYYLDQNGAEHPAFIMDYMAGVQLERCRDKLSGTKQGMIPANKVLQAASQMINAFLALEVAGVAHGDLHTQNILLDINSNTALVEGVALLDYGKARHEGLFTPTPPHKEKGPGVFKFGSPENFGGEFKEEYYDKPPSNMWSFGALLYWMRTGSEPFHEAARNMEKEYGKTRDDQGELKLALNRFALQKKRPFRYKLKPIEGEPSDDLELLNRIIEGTVLYNPMDRLTAIQVKKMLEAHKEKQDKGPTDASPIEEEANGDERFSGTASKSGKRDFRIPGSSVVGERPQKKSGKLGWKALIVILWLLGFLFASIGIHNISVASSIGMIVYCIAGFAFVLAVWIVCRYLAKGDRPLTVFVATAMLIYPLALGFFPYVSSYIPAHLGFAGSQTRLAACYAEGQGVAQDYIEASEWYGKAAEQGNATLQTNLGDVYRDGKGVTQDHVQAVEWYRKAADQGYSVAQSLMGDAYWDGKGVTQDHVQAVEWYRKAADQGYSVAQNQMGVAYWKGEGVEQDYAQAVEWFRKAADQRHSAARYNLGNTYWNGEGVEQDHVQAVEWYRKAADQGYSVAQNRMGLAYWKGEGVEQDYAQAVEWFRKAADQRNSAACNNLGNAYRNGKGVEQDYAQAVEWYRKAADQGYSAAHNNLGNVYWNGESVEQDYIQALEWYRKAADQGYLYAQYNLGNAYRDGKGVEQDYIQALEWYRKAADQGYSAAQNQMGVAYWDGKGIGQDYVQAVEWFRKAADQGYSAACHNLGNAYRNGKGVEQDYVQGVEWYRKAADQGYSAAQNRMGVACWDGEGVEQDYVQAVEWYRKAADQGHLDAQYNLGYAYWEGKGVEQDIGLAKEWFQKAADQGDQDALKFLE